MLLCCCSQFEKAFRLKMNLEKIKNTIFKYFKVWWIPIVSYIITFFIFLLGEGLKSDNIIDISLIIFFTNILGNIISAIVQIFIKKWYYLIPQILISGLLFVFVSIIFTFSPPDYYGARIELWFEPINGNKEYKITERNYVVEGWMR